jgi:hypothetical protein
MRTLLACMTMAALPAWAAETPAPVDMKAATQAAATCAECGVVRTVRMVTKEIKTDPASDARPSGLVASFPLDGGKASAGSSARIGKDARMTDEIWQVIVRYDDGRYRLVTLDNKPDVREGDKVRFEPDGTLVLRTD